MNGDLIPAIVAAGGGSALLSGIWAYERRRDDAMRASRVRLGLRFPANLDPVVAKAALSNLAGLPLDVELIFEILADGDGIKFVIWVPAAVRNSVVATLTGVAPGLRVTEALVMRGRATLALRIFVPTPSTLSTESPEAAARALLAGLSSLTPNEQVAIRWAVRPGRAPDLRADEPLDRAGRARAQAWRQKSRLAGGFQASGLVLVHADTISRARELGEHVASAFRSRRGAVGRLRVTYERGSRSFASLPRTTRSSGWLNASEIMPLLAWPLGDEHFPGVEVGAARALSVPRHVPREGRRLFIGRDARGERPVALSAEAALHHSAVIGRTGVGKSVLLAHGILDDIERGFAGVVIDPKADLVETVLSRVKPEHADRIVVLDAADPRVPGVAALAGDGDPDLRAEALTGAIRSAFPADAWGVRTDFYLRLAIRTLAAMPGATLADVGRLFFEESFRRKALALLVDPFLTSTWQLYASLSPAAQAEHVQAPMARIMALLSRPRVRAVIANPEPKLDVARLFAERKFLLISLSPGVGESAAALLSGVLMYVVWNAIEQRVVLAPAERHPIFLHVDELATLTNGLPFSFELLAERARGLGAGLTVAMQTIGRIPEPTRSALIGNVATLIAFRAGAEEAERLARQLPGLSAADLLGLQRFEVAARVGTGLGSATMVVTGRTEALPPATGQAEAIRRRSRERYGSDFARPKPSESKRDDGSIGRAQRDA
jgi:hypothetical protein